jgi:hypothetical protein
MRMCVFGHKIDSKIHAKVRVYKSNTFGRSARPTIGLTLALPRADVSQQSDTRHWNIQLLPSLCRTHVSRPNPRYVNRQFVHRTYYASFYLSHGKVSQCSRIRMTSWQFMVTCMPVFLKSRHGSIVTAWNWVRSMIVEAKTHRWNHWQFRKCEWWYNLAFLSIIVLTTDYKLNWTSSFPTPETGNSKNRSVISLFACNRTTANQTVLTLPQRMLYVFLME